MDIDSIRIHFDEGQMVLMNFCLAFIMFGIALDMKMDDFKRILQFPRKILIGLSSQWILLPLMTLGLIAIWQPFVSISLGLVLVASCPGGNISNFAVHMSKGNTALSISLTSIVTILAVITTPFIFSNVSALVPGAESYLQKITLDPWRLAGLVFRLIIIPLILGMVINAYFPKWTQPFKKPIKILSILIFAGFIFFALYGNMDNIRDHLMLVFWIVIVHNILAMAMGYYYAKTWGLPQADRKAICLETGIQNSGLGLIIIFNFFPEIGGMILTAAWWGIWDLISSFAIAFYWGKFFITAKPVLKN